MRIKNETLSLNDTEYIISKKLVKKVALSKNNILKVQL